MVLNRLIRTGAPIARNICTSPVRKGYNHTIRRVVGSLPLSTAVKRGPPLTMQAAVKLAKSMNLPFQINNRYRLIFTFIVYFGSGLGLPFFILRYMILSKRT